LTLNHFGFQRIVDITSFRATYSPSSVTTHICRKFNQRNQEIVIYRGYRVD